MRFLCEQCKAKYQIADEKVAGKTVRMKCRKCGHLIEVKAEVTETSVASKAPPPPGPDEINDDATRVGMDVGAILRSAGPATAKPGAPRPGAKPGLATSLAAAKPARPSAPHHPQGSALAGAFQRSVARDDDRAMVDISTSREWYVAINGVPVGPVRIAELRRKASIGAVTEDSLVWQEGMEEWRPLRTIPELVAIVSEGLSSERPSLVTPAPPSGPPRSAPIHTQHPQRTPSRPAEALRPAASAARNNVVSLASRLATAEKLEPEPVADPFALPGPKDPTAPSSGVDPFGAPAAPAPSLASPLLVPPSVAAPTVVIPRRSGPNWLVIGIVVAFGAFGAMAGISVFFRQTTPQPAPTIVVTTQGPAPPGPVAAGGTAAPPDTGAIEIASAEPGKPAVAHAHGGGGHPAAGAPTGHAVDPSIAALLGGPGTGPSVGGAGAGGSASSALSEDAIRRVVQQRSTGVKRTCWERGGSSESNVNVRVHLSIAASGHVQSASADGNDQIVTKCIENNVRGWVFPPSSGSTTVDIPFHFLRQ
jgi:predicted Zn finger-like uncharacterized protein